MSAARPLYIRMHDADNVAIVVNDGGLPAGAVFESYSQARANGCGANDFSAMADAVCDLARIPRARVPRGWKPA